METGGQPGYYGKGSARRGRRPQVQEVLHTFAQNGGVKIDVQGEKVRSQGRKEKPILKELPRKKTKGGEAKQAN